MAKFDCIAALQKAGISELDARALRRISMTLNRWFELECGTDSCAIEREEPWAIARAGTFSAERWWNGSSWAREAERRTYSDHEREALRDVWTDVETWRAHQSNPDNPRLPFDAAWRETGGRPYLTFDSGLGNGKRKRIATPDRETGAKARLARIMKAYPTLGYYVQGDPRGAALYVLRPGDVPEGKPVDSYYSRGIAVYR